jgi:uncharacterized protein (TIGR02453 family)
MSDAFANLIPDARRFFAELQGNNSRDWFEANKARYTKTIRKPAEALAEVMAADFGRLTGRKLSSKVYRINRDVRFSKDKSPYNTHLHMLWSFGAENRPGWFFAVSPETVSLSTGVMSFTPEGLDWVRHAIADDPQPWRDAVAAIEAAGGTLADWGEAPLKRVPKPWDDGHPAADLLRRKSLILTLPLMADDRASDLLDRLRGAAGRLLPFWSCFDARGAE